MSLIYPEQCYSGPKKIGKSAFNAMHTLTTTLVYGGRFGEALVLANDLEQAVSRTFTAIRRIVEASPYLADEAVIKQNRIEFPSTGASITALASDAAGAAGSNANIASFDELWAYTSTRSHRLFDELVPPPTKRVACRLTTTYAGFSGESELLEGLYKRGLAQPCIGPDLHGGDGLLMFWTHEPQAPWQDEHWLAQIRASLRPNQFLRMIENRWVTGEESFIDIAEWDACTTVMPIAADPNLPVWVVGWSPTKSSNLHRTSRWISRARSKRPSCRTRFEPFS